jgi:hypothetical protein
MTGHDKILDQLSAYLDGELTDAEAKRVEEAVRRSKELTDELARLRATRDLIRGLPKAKAPDGLVDRIMSQAERFAIVGARPGERRQKPARWVRYVADAAVIVVGAGIGMVIKFTMDVTEQDRRQVARTEKREQPAVSGAEKERKKDGKISAVEIAAKDKGLAEPVARRLGLREDRPGAGAPAAPVIPPPAPGEKPANGETGLAVVASKVGAKGAGTRAELSDEAARLSKSEGLKDYGDSTAQAPTTRSKFDSGVRDDVALMAQTLANAKNVTIDAIDLPANRSSVRKDVETILARNDIEPWVADDGTKGRSESHQDRVNVFHANVEAHQVQYIAFADRQQVPALLKQLLEAQMKQVAVADENVKQAGERDLQHLRAVVEAQHKLEGKAAEAVDRAADLYVKPRADAAREKAQPKPGGEDRLAAAPAQALPSKAVDYSKRQVETARKAASRPIEQAAKAASSAVPATQAAKPGWAFAAKGSTQPVQAAAVQQAQGFATGTQLTLARQALVLKNWRQIGADVESIVITINFVPVEQAAQVADQMRNAAGPATEAKANVTELQRTTAPVDNTGKANSLK